MYPNIAANLPRAFPRYKLSDEDYTLKLFINEAKEITILGHIDNNFLMWLSKGTLSYIKLSSTLEFLLHKRLPHVVSQYELEKCGYPNQGAWILFSAKYFIKRADDGWRIETGTGWITGRGLTPGHELSGVFSNGLALADVIIRDYKRYYDAHPPKREPTYTQELLAELKSLREQLQKKSASTDAEFEMQKRYISLLERNCLLNSVYTRSGQNSTPNSNATNLHSSQKRCCSFCISSSNASPTFQVQKSIFHQMTKPIQVTVILPLLLAISFSRNDDIHSSISGISNDLIGVIPTIGQ